MLSRTGYIVRLRQLALGRNWRKWCCGCVAELGKEWKGDDGVARVGERDRESGYRRVRLRLPWLDDGFIVWIRAGENN